MPSFGTIYRYLSHLHTHAVLESEPGSSKSAHKDTVQALSFFLSGIPTITLYIPNTDLPAGTEPAYRTPHLGNPESIASWELWSSQAHRHFLRLLLLFLGSELLRQSLSIQGPRGRSAGTKRLGSGSERSPGTRRPTQGPETRRTQPGRRHLAEGGVRPRRTEESTRRGWGGGGLCWSRGCPARGSRGQCALSAAAPAGSCSWSGGVWSRRGECVGEAGLGLGNAGASTVSSWPGSPFLESTALGTESRLGTRSHSKPLPRPRAL